MNLFLKKHIQRVMLLGALCGFFAACEPELQEPTVATVGASKLTLSELHASIEYAPAKDSATAAAIYIEDWKRTAALYELARQVGIETDTIGQVLVKKATRRILTQRFVDIEMQKAEAAGKFKVDSVEVKAFFEANHETFFYREPAVQLIRLYASSSDSATRMLRLLSQRRHSFEHISEEAKIIAPEREELNTRSLENATQLIRVSRLHLESETLRQLLQKMRPSNVSPIVKLSDSLFVVMRLEARVETGTKKSLKETYDEILHRLKLKKQKAFYAELQRRAQNALQR